MKIDGLVPARLDRVAEEVADMERRGIRGAWTAEAAHDPFLPLTLAAEHTDHLEIGTSIAVAFARNPMLLAHLGYDLQAYSGGRMMLGLGSQIKAHVTKRFSMPWSRPAARMREMVAAIRAIWTAWDTGERLQFRGDFYTHTLMTPFFSPGPNPHGPPRIFLAAVGEGMLATTGAVADGWISHPFTTPAYLHDVGLGAIDRAAVAAGRSSDDIEVALAAFVVTGDTEEEMAATADAVRQQIAFYGSTPAYVSVLDHHGWGDAHTELNRLSKRGDWATMGEVIDDEMLATFAVVAEPDAVADEVFARFGGVVDRLSLYPVGGPSPSPVWTRVTDALVTRAASS